MDANNLQGDLLSRLSSLCKSGKFQIHSLYLSLLPICPRMEWKSLMATTNVLPRHKFTVWMAAHGRLPTVDRLLKFGISVDEACVFCNQNIEEFEHLYFDCPVTSRIWSRICCWLGYNKRIGCWKNELTWICCNARSKQFKKAVIATAFVTTVSLIWRCRNAIRFEKKPFDDNLVCREIAILIHARGRRCKKWLKGLRQLNYYP